MAEYWLISAPGDKTCQQTWETMNNVTNKQNSLCNNFKFHIPDLKVIYKLKTFLVFSSLTQKIIDHNANCVFFLQVGTLDQLVGLSDDLGKLDAYVENITRKVAIYLGEVLEDQRDKLQENLLANNSEFVIFTCATKYKT